jgi:hypothetical protein
MEEYIYRVGSFTHKLDKPPFFYVSGGLLTAGCTFGSVYAVRKEDAEAITTAGTAANYRGTCWSRRLWLDFDDEASLKQTLEFLKKENYDHVVYHTGNRGGHVGILRDAAPSHLLPYQDKKWAVENAPGCDRSIYWALHLFRLPGTVHDTTGLPKRLVSKHEGKELVLPSYEPEAPKDTRTPIGIKGSRGSIFKCWQVVSRLTLGEVANRQKHLVVLCKALRHDAGVTLEEATWVALEVNRGFDEPKPQEEVIRIVNWAYEV